MLGHFHADMAFISTKSVSLPDGLYETHLPLIEVKKKIVSVSDKVILLADYRKFSYKALCLSIPLQDIDMIISDERMPRPAREHLTAMEKQFMLV